MVVGADNKDLHMLCNYFGNLQAVAKDEIQTFEDLCISPARIVVARQPIRFPQYFCQ
jgi:hypothetical protein